MNKALLKRIISYRNASLSVGTLVCLRHDGGYSKKHIQEHTLTVDLIGEMYTAGSNTQQFLITTVIPNDKNMPRSTDKDRHLLFATSIVGYVVASVQVEVSYVTGNTHKVSYLHGRKIFSPTNNLYYFIPDCCLKRMHDDDI